MSTRKKNKLSKNAEMIITCIITLVLCLAGYVLSLVANTGAMETEVKRNLIIDGLNNSEKIISVLSGSLSPSLIVWCIIGLITNFSKASFLKTTKIKPAIAILFFVVYLIWYIIYLTLENLFPEVHIANICASCGILIITLLFFNEYKGREKNKR